MEMIHDEISLQIISSVKKLAQAKSASKITVRDVLHDLNISNRVFYNRFHNIEEVLECLYLETINRVRDSLSIPWDNTMDYWEHILEVASRTLIFTYESRQNMSQYIFEADAGINSNFDWWNQEIKKLIQIGKQQHYIHADLDEGAISYSIWCFIRGFNTDAMSRNLPREEALSLFRSGFGCFLNGMKTE